MMGTDVNNEDAGNDGKTKDKNTGASKVTNDDNKDAEKADTKSISEEEEEFRLSTTEERRAQGLCCPVVNRSLLLSKSFYFCFFSAWGSLLPYLALYFKQLMLTPSQVGVIMGLKPFVNFLATPVWGALVDKFHIHKFALIISMTALITSTFALSLVPGPKQQTIILEKHCNRTDMTEMMALVGEPEVDKMVLSDSTQDYYFSKSRWPWPVDFVASFEENMYVRYNIDATKTFTMLFLITLFGNVIASPTLALVDTATLQMLGKETHRYGKQRLMGSLGWGMGAFIVGASLKTTHHCSMKKSREIVDYIPCFYVFAVLMTLGLVVSMKFKFRVKKKKGPGASLSAGLMALKYPTYLMFLFTALYLGFLMAFIKTFLFWHLKDLGGTQLLFSVISAVNCVAEVSMYFLSERLIAKIGEVKVLYLGLICYSVRLFYYSVLPYPWLVLVVELLPGITTAAVWAACLSYVSINSRPGAQTTMQCILHGVHWGLGYGAGEVIGGILVHHYGAPKTFVLFGILCIVILFLYLLIKMIWGKSEQELARSNSLQAEAEENEGKSVSGDKTSDSSDEKDVKPDSSVTIDSKDQVNKSIDDVDGPRIPSIDITRLQDIDKNSKERPLSNKDKIDESIDEKDGGKSPSVDIERLPDLDKNNEQTAKSEIEDTLHNDNKNFLTPPDNPGGRINEGKPIMLTVDK